MDHNKYVLVNGHKYKVPARYQGNVWEMAAYADGVAKGQEVFERPKPKKGKKR